MIHTSRVFTEHNYYCDVSLSGNDQQKKGRKEYIGGEKEWRWVDVFVCVQPLRLAAEDVEHIRETKK
jgi:hypothetical protein